MNERLGKTFKDKITGFKGVATGHCEYLTGCNQTLLAPIGTDPTKRPESEWFDDQRLDEVDVPVVKLNNTETPGCDREAPKQ